MHRTESYSYGNNKSWSYNQSSAAVNYHCSLCGKVGHYPNKCPNFINQQGQLLDDSIPLHNNPTKKVALTVTSLDGIDIRNKTVIPNKDGTFDIIENSSEGLRRLAAIGDTIKATTALNMSEVPEYLKCVINGAILKDAVSLPCCSKCVNDDTIRLALLKNNLTCPLCHKENIGLDSLKVRQDIRNSVSEYIKSKSKKEGAATQGYATATPFGYGQYPISSHAQPYSSTNPPYIPPVQFPPPYMMGPSFDASSWGSGLMPLPPGVAPPPRETFPPPMSREDFEMEKKLQIEEKKNELANYDDRNRGGYRGGGRGYRGGGRGYDNERFNRNNHRGDGANAGYSETETNEGDRRRHGDGSRSRSRNRRDSRDRQQGSKYRSRSNERKRYDSRDRDRRPPNDKSRSRSRERNDGGTRGGRVDSADAGGRRGDSRERKNIRGDSRDRKRRDDSRDRKRRDDSRDRKRRDDSRERKHNRGDSRDRRNDSKRSEGDSRVDSKRSEGDSRVDSKRSEGDSRVDSKRSDGDRRVDSKRPSSNEGPRGGHQNRSDAKSRDYGDKHNKIVEKASDDRKFKDVRELLNGGNASRVVSVVSNDGDKLANRTTKKTKKY